MHNFFEISALISAFSWAISGAILKTIKLKNVLSFPFYEAIVSLLLLSVFISFFYSWSSIFSQNLNSLILFAIGTGIGCVGFINYVTAIKKISIGIVFTVSASCNLLMISLLTHLILSKKQLSFRRRVFSSCAQVQAQEKPELLLHASSILY